MDIVATIQDQLDRNPVLIDMKGTPEAPQCGFSARAVAALTSTGVQFAFVNILQNPAIREQLPRIANWPTFPQVFVGGDLIGGSDIVAAMAADGTLKALVESATSKPPAMSGA